MSSKKSEYKKLEKIWTLVLVFGMTLMVGNTKQQKKWGLKKGKNMIEKWSLSKE